MSKKFTEEQYQNIVETVNKYPDFGSVYYVQNGWVESKPTNTFNELIEALSYTVSGESEVNIMLALANPLTREWAHDQYVEKEKQYVWRLKSDNDLVISKWSSGWFADEFPTNNNHFSEKEIENSPFKPEFFDKEEVD